MVNRTDRVRRPLAAADYVRLAEFRFLLRRFLVFSERAARRAGLTVQQHQALLAIKGGVEREAVTVGDLAARLAIRHHSAVGLVDRLELKGLVRRWSARSDRRQIRVALTSKAESKLARLSAVHRDELERLAPLMRVLLAEFARRGTKK